jgi:cation:H+ antiporter
MLIQIVIFVVALAGLLMAAKFFTDAAEKIGLYFKFPSFVIGIFIVGIGTSLPELVSGILSVNKNASEILSGNIIGANISNILLITGLAVALNRKTISLGSAYIYIDLHFLIGAIFFFYMIAYDGIIVWNEAFIGILMFLVYSIYLIRNNTATDTGTSETAPAQFPIKDLGLLLLAGVGIYFGADYTVASLEQIALALRIPPAIIALTLLSLGTTLPELAVNISAIKAGKAEMAMGNVLGSCIFNTLAIPGITSLVGSINVPGNLLGFSLPVMAGCGLLFYLLTQDKKISVWEGLMLVLLYLLFMLKIAGF